MLFWKSHVGDTWQRCIVGDVLNVSGCHCSLIPNSTCNVIFHCLQQREEQQWQPCLISLWIIHAFYFEKNSFHIHWLNHEELMFWQLLLLKKWSWLFCYCYLEIWDDSVQFWVWLNLLNVQSVCFYSEAYSSYRGSYIKIKALLRQFADVTGVDLLIEIRFSKWKLHIISWEQTTHHGKLHLTELSAGSLNCTRLWK